MKLLDFGMSPGPADKICGIYFTGGHSMSLFVLNTVSAM